MVSKKYLCAAPRPESWEARRQALLKSFGGDRKQREQAIRQTLDTLRSIHEEKKRVGPGRKSKAEHAIAFYEYILEDTNDDATEDEKSDDEAKKVQKEQKPAENTPATNNPDDAMSDSSTDTEDSDGPGMKRKAEEKGSGDSIGSQEFLDEHNDVCDVCNKGGELLCCSTCTLVFHLACVRPMLTTFPDDDWSCAHCIVQGLRGYKRHSKPYRAASAGVRHMNKLREELQGAPKDDGKVDAAAEAKEKSDGNVDQAETGSSSPKKETKSNGDGAVTTIAVAKVDIQMKGADDVAPKGNTAVDKKPSDSEKEKEKETEKEKEDPNTDKSQPRPNTNSGDGNDGDSGNGGTGEAKPAASDDKNNKGELTPTRSRRQRKQPVLYKPQDCADSEWQSDDKHEWATSGAETEEDYENEKEGGKRTTRERKKKGNKQSCKEAEAKYWCNFCRDDPSIPVCCFCACRVCFGKHSKSQLLLCDRCDAEYHTFCLDPPLKSVPVSKSWFCPSCQKVEDTPSVGSRRVQITSMDAPASVGAKNRQSTKRKALALNSSSSETGSSPSSPRKVGRPKSRKSAKLKDTTGQSSSASPSPTKVKRGPGRPRGRPPKKAAPATPRKRGRPPKNPDAKPTTPRKRGRPPKSQSASPSSASPSKRSKTKSAAASAVEKKAPSSVASGSVSVSTSASTSAPSSPTKRNANVTSKDKGGSTAISPSAATSSMAPRKVSTPRRGSDKDASGKTTEASDASSPGESRAVKQSRSGRIVKRSSFYDEIEEGDQHLRLERNKSDSRRKSSSSSPASSKSKTEASPSKVKEPPQQQIQLQQQQQPQEPTQKPSTPAKNDWKIDGRARILKPKAEEPALPVVQRQKAAATSATKVVASDRTVMRHSLDTVARRKPVVAPVASMSTVARRPPKNVARMQPGGYLAKQLQAAQQRQQHIATVNKVRSDTAKLPAAAATTTSTAATASRAPVPATTAKSASAPASQPQKQLTTETTATAASASAAGGTAVDAVAVAPKSAVTAANGAQTSNASQLAEANETVPATAAAARTRAPSLTDSVSENAAADAAASTTASGKVPRRKPGARECMQISRRFGNKVIPERYMEILLDYCNRGKVEHLIRMRERLDEHARYLELQLAGLEAMVQEKGATDVVVPPIPETLDKMMISKDRFL
mmetsp:Transcript_11938/g.34485  ORF Transcript_11938/g.34485 Transcript_11938/m.34485 type:complete len:1165 (+) Transcript_11938:106-3600(+)